MYKFFNVCTFNAHENKINMSFTSKIALILATILIKNKLETSYNFRNIEGFYGNLMVKVRVN